MYSFNCCLRAKDTAGAPAAMVATTMSSALTTVSASVARRPAPRVQAQCRPSAFFRPGYGFNRQCQPNAWRTAARRYGQGRMSQQDIDEALRVSSPPVTVWPPPATLLPLASCCYVHLPRVLELCYARYVRAYPVHQDSQLSCRGTCRLALQAVQLSSAHVNPPSCCHLRCNICKHLGHWQTTTAWLLEQSESPPANVIQAECR